MTEKTKQKGLGGRDATDATIPGDYAISVGHPGTELPDGWVWTPLNDLADLASGHTPSRKRPDYWGGDIPWIGIKDATGNHGRTIMSTNEYTNELGIKNSAARVLPKGTVCLSRTASVGYVVTMGREMATSQDFVNWTCSSRLDARFLKYALIVEGDALLRFASGSVHQTIYVPEVKAFHLATPSLAEQQSIADLLGSLDDKIELNRRMNETLEEMARSLFRDWFVDFGPTCRQIEGATDPAAIMGHAFPPEKAASLVLMFPAKLGDDDLPEGWEKRPLDEIGHFLNGLALQKFPAQDGKPDLPVIKIAELRNGITQKSNRASTDVPEKYVIGNGDFIFSWSGSLMAKFWTGGPGALNQHLFKVTSEGHPMWFVSEWVQTHLEEFQRIAASKAVTMGHIKRSHLAEAMCVCPDDKALAAFGEVFDPLIAKQIANAEENQTLAEMRDLLLPKLMSGEIRLKDVEVVQFSDVSKPASVGFTDLLGDQYLMPEQEDERDAVIIAATVGALQKDGYVVGNVRVMKGAYLLKRRLVLPVSGFERKAAGPYDRALNREIRGYARERSWIKETTTLNSSGERIRGNRPARKYSEVVPLIAEYELSDAIDWLARHFKGASRNWMECVATVDFALQELNRKGLDVTVANIKADIASDPEWKPKLEKPHFADIEIKRATSFIEEIFAE